MDRLKMIDKKLDNKKIIRAGGRGPKPFNAGNEDRRRTGGGRGARGSTHR
jgi:hypothetical protein